MYDELRRIYEAKKEEIRARIEEFKKMRQASDEEIFSELAFCLCTPQSKAVECDKAIKQLVSAGLLFKGNERQIRPFLDRVRFSENKAKFIVLARELFSNNGEIEIKKRINSFRNSKEAREWLVKHIKGFGYKEASHFLRNIGLADDLAILDRHILRCLKEFGIIDEIPKSLTPKKYLEIEERMRKFAEELNLSLVELDLVLFYRQTGLIFK